MSVQELDFIYSIEKLWRDLILFLQGDFDEIQDDPDDGGGHG